MAREVACEDERIEKEEWMEEYDRQHELQWDEAFEEQMQIAIAWVVDHWDPYDDNEEFYLTKKFDNRLQKRLDTWALD